MSTDRSPMYDRELEEFATALRAVEIPDGSRLDDLLADPRSNAYGVALWVDTARPHLPDNHPLALQPSAARGGRPGFPLPGG